MAFKTKKWAVGGIVAVLGLLPLSVSAAEVKTVPRVNLQDYSGIWYEIASFPSPFQPANCTGTTATYTYNSDGSIKVWNQCYLPTAAGVDELLRIEGRAVATDDTQSKLKVSFFGPFAGDYWILDLDDNYQHVLVGSPNRRFLWILNRDPDMDPQVYKKLLAKAQKQGFDVQKLRATAPRKSR